MKEPCILEEYTVKNSKMLKGQRCAPSVWLSPRHFASIDKDANAYLYLEILILFFKKVSESDFWLS